MPQTSKVSGSTKTKAKAKSAATSSKSTAGNNSLNNSGANNANAAADERRLRKLKVFLKSISFNGSEGLRFETLNDLYFDQVITNEPPCSDLSASEEYKCNATPFIVASCFNRTQITSTKPKKVRATSRRAPQTKKSSTQDIKSTEAKTTPTKSSNARTVSRNEKKLSDDKKVEIKLSEKGNTLVAPTTDTEKNTSKANNIIIRSDNKQGQKVKNHKM